MQSFNDVMADSRFARSSGRTPEGNIYRGCKDGAIATCRALSERFDIKVNTSDWKQLNPSDSRFRASVTACWAQARPEEIEALWDVLVAANRAVCHLEDNLIDHRVDEPTLERSISVVTAIAKKKMQDAGLSF
jgi:hypothetical protein